MEYSGTSEKGMLLGKRPLSLVERSSLSERFTFFFIVLFYLNEFFFFFFFQFLTFTQ